MNHLKKYQKYIHNMGWLLGQQVYTLLISFIIGALSARYLGPSDYGIIGYVGSYVGLFSAVAQMGLEGIVINKLIAFPEKKGEIIGSALLIRFIAGLFSMFSVLLLIRYIEPNNKIIWIIAVLQSLSLVVNIHTIFGYWFQSELLSKYASISSMVGSTTSNGWRVVQLIMKNSAVWFAATALVQSFVSLVLMIYFFVKYFNEKLSYSRLMMCDLLSKSYHFMIASVSIAIYTQIDKIMLGGLLDEQSVGYYTVAMTLANMWGFIPTAIVNSARPIVFEAKKTNSGYIKKLQLLLLLITLLGVIVGVGFMIFGGLAIRLIYGIEYAKATAPMLIIIWATSLAALGSVRAIWIISEDKSKYVNYYIVIGAVINILGNYTLIPQYGMSGAAFVTLITQFIVTLIAPLFFKETRQFVFIYVKSFLLLRHFPSNIKKFKI